MMGDPGEGKDIFVGGEGEVALLEVEHVAHAERCGGEEGGEEEEEMDPETVVLMQRGSLTMDVSVRIFEQTRGWAHGRQLEEELRGLVTLVDDVQVFAWLETDSLAWGDADFSTCTRIPSDTGFARANGKYSEAAKFDAVTGGECLFHGIEDGVDCSFCPGAR